MHAESGPEQSEVVRTLQGTWVSRRGWGSVRGSGAPGGSGGSAAGARALLGSLGALCHERRGLPQRDGRSEKRCGL